MIDMPSPCRHWCAHDPRFCLPENLMTVKMVKKCKSYMTGDKHSRAQRDYLNRHYKLTVQEEMRPISKKDEFKWWNYLVCINCTVEKPETCPPEHQMSVIMTEKCSGQKRKK